METSRPEEPSKKVEAPETALLQYKEINKLFKKSVFTIIIKKDVL